MRPKESMKIKAQVTLRFQDSGLHIEIRDESACVQFVEIDINDKHALQALGGLGCVPATAEIRGLDKVGKTHECKHIKAALPKGHLFSSDRKEMASKAIEKVIPKGWKSDDTFNSQNSFFTEDGVEMCRTIMRRWV